MRYALAFLAAIPALSLAAPAPLNNALKRTNGYKSDKWDDKDDHKDDYHYEADAFPFEFTSTLVAWAGPDQVINNSQVAVFGLPGAWGTYKFGLDSVTDTLCYVSCCRAHLHSGLTEAEHLGLPARQLLVARGHRHAHPPGQPWRCRPAPDRLSQSPAQARTDRGLGTRLRVALQSGLYHRSVHHWRLEQR